jgi:hypothetical protein
MIFKTADNLSVKRVEKGLESSFMIKARIVPSRKICQKDSLEQKLQEEQSRTKVFRTKVIKGTKQTKGFCLLGSFYNFCSENFCSILFLL